MTSAYFFFFFNMAFRQRYWFCKIMLLLFVYHYCFSDYRFSIYKYTVEKFDLVSLFLPSVYEAEGVGVGGGISLQVVHSRNCSSESWKPLYRKIFWLVVIIFICWMWFGFEILNFQDPEILTQGTSTRQGNKEQKQQNPFFHHLFYLIVKCLTIWITILSNKWKA